MMSLSRFNVMLLLPALFVTPAMADFNYGSAIAQNNGSVFLEDTFIDVSVGDSFFGHPNQISVDLVNRGISGNADVFSTETTFGASLSVGPGFLTSDGFGQAVNMAEVTVNQPTQILFEWDLTSVEFPQALVFTELYDATNSTIQLQGTVGTAGSELYTLMPGVDYEFTMRFSVTIDETFTGGDIYGRISQVPAPGAVGLFAGAGLCAGRRRKRKA